MLTDGTVRDRWIDRVHASTTSAEVKVYLLFLERYHMDSSGRVCEKRDDLAASVGCHPRKISEKFAAGVKAGLLLKVARGQGGQNAAYQIVVPLAQGADNRHPEAVQGADNRHPENRAPYEDRARARSDGDRSSPTPAPARDKQDAPLPGEPNKESVSQASRRREAHRWLMDRYRLTDEQAAEVYREVDDRAATPLHSPVNYLAAMAEQGHLADIVAAVTATAAEESAPPAPPALSVVTSTTGCDRHPRGAVDPVAPEGWGACMLCNDNRRRATARGIPADAQPLLTELPQPRRSRPGRDPDAPYQPSLLLAAAADPGPDTSTATRATDGSLTFPAADTETATG